MMRTVFVGALKAVRTEVIPLRLEHIGSRPRAGESIKIVQRSCQRRHWLPRAHSPDGDLT